MNTVESAYKAYLKNGNNCIDINDEQYFRIVFKECFNLSNLGPVLVIVLPMELFKDRKGNTIEDEKGNKYELSGPEMLKFFDGIPDWYLNCFSFIIKGIDSVEGIGNYVKVVCD